MKKNSNNRKTSGRDIKPGLRSTVRTPVKSSVRSKQHPKLPVNRYAVWKYLVIFLSLTFLGISALPNLYQNQLTLVVSEYREGAPKLAVNFLKNNLTAGGFGVDTIRQTNAESVIHLTSGGQITAAQYYLNKHLNSVGEHSANMYRVEIVETDTRPSWLRSFGVEPIKLGLDLSGGVLFVLDVDAKKAFEERMQNIRLFAKSLLREQQVRNVNVTLTNQNQVVVDASATTQAWFSLVRLTEKLNEQYPQLTIRHLKDSQLQLEYSDVEKRNFLQQIMGQTLSTMRGRIEELGITEAVVQRQGAHRVRIELPGASNPDKVRPIIGATASLDFYELQHRGGKTVKAENGERLSVNPSAIFSGTNIHDAQAGRDEMGQPLVNLTLDNIGGEKMLKFSAKNIGKPMVTVFSEYYQSENGETYKKSKVINVATIQAQLGARFSITNLESSAQAQELALLLRAGSLTAPVTIAKQRTIAATLGESNINRGLSALMLGVGLTLVFMAGWYRRLGMIANCALTLNLMALLGLMSLLPGAVLTLPGIAGFVLTVGMAVDTNVLIFERIKQEKRRGLSHFLAIEQGYKNAFSTILDANITTLITAAILYSIGYGPVKGFAVTLGLGVITSMFTGVFISRALTNVFYSETAGATDKIFRKTTASDSLPDVLEGKNKGIIDDSLKTKPNKNSGQSPRKIKPSKSIIKGGKSS